MADAQQTKSIACDTDALHRFVVEVETQCRELGGPHFDFDCTFILASGMQSLGRIAEAIHDNPKRIAAIFGHTDTVGDERYNKTLSEQRARVALAALTHEVAPWEERSTAEHWGPRTIQAILNALALTEPLAEDGIAGPRTEAAVRDYQKQRGLAVDGVVGPHTRRSLYRDYHQKFIPNAVPAGRFRDFGGHHYMGCGEFNPFTEGVADAASRRVVVLLFGPTKGRQGLPCALGTVAPCHGNLRDEKAPAAAGDASPHFRCQVYRRISVNCPCQPDEELMPFRAQLHDIQYRRCGNLEYSLALPSGRVLHGRTDGDGWLRNAVPKGRQVVTVTYTPAGENQQYVLPVRLTDADARSDDALLCHVFNIGYGRSDDDDRWMLLRFQADSQLPLSGELDARTRDAIDKLIHGASDSLQQDLGG